VTSALLDVRDVSAGYGETTVLRSVGIQVRPEQTVALIGPNGHGKTTLLRTVSGLIHPRSGEIRLEGERIDDVPAEELGDRGLVHIPQGDHLFADLTVEENLLMGAFPRSAWRLRRDGLDRAYALFPQLEERQGQRARTLSGGERRQVALARGLMRDARLLLVDEPALGLAPVLIEAVYAAIGRVAEAGTAILLVEENFNHIRGLADSVCVLEMGRIVRTGSVDELLRDETITHSYLGEI
jgi:branched-chain amino acid transport system ATP-binding protein